MRILITGGAGFVGRALVKRCLAAEAEVAVIDNLCAGSAANLEPFRERIQVFEWDILDQEKLANTIATFRPNTVFHLAAHHFIPFCNAHPAETLRLNVEGTFAVLTEAARSGAEVAVLASSGAIYPSSSAPLTEATPASPVDVYGLSKAMAEQVAAFVAAQASMRCVAARLFNVYGPHETNPHLIPEIVAGLKQGSRLSLGNLQTKRDYVYVDDVADMLFRSAAAKTDGLLTVNIGTGEEYSAQEIVDAFAGILGRRIDISLDERRVRAVDKPHQRADTTLMTALTGARARHSLMEGLRLLAEHERLLPVR